MTEQTVLLPAWLRTALMRAAAIKDEVQRRREIERLTDVARQQYPSKFRPEVTHGANGRDE